MKTKVGVLYWTQCTNQERIIVKTDRQSLYILCEELFDTWQWAVADENGTWSNVR